MTTERSGLIKHKKNRTGAGNRKSKGQEPCFIVGIGASAGGQVALEQMFTTMPHGCGLAFIVAMHLPPEGPSFLADILSRYTVMDVVTAEDGMGLCPDTVYVIPAGMEVFLNETVLRLQKIQSGLHLIDRLFFSFAAEVSNRMIAVVLSGSGRDGVEGIKKVKACGGIVLVQEPASALYPDMPRSAIASGAADLVLSVEEIAGKIAEIAKGTCAITSFSCRSTSEEEDLQAVFNIVKADTGYDFSCYKRNTVMRRIERRMMANETSGLKKYLALLEENTLEAQALAQDILIGVTGFFRDKEAFKTIRNEVIPQMFANRDADDTVRIWHACCATGEEVYSMAFLIMDYLREHRLQVKVQMFATDIDETSVAQARTGIYDDSIQADLDEETLRNYFTRINDNWQVNKAVREMVVFAHHSLIKDPPFSRLDMLVCRNFLIYLTPDMQRRLVSLFYQVLKPAGVLFLGSAETVGRNEEGFAAIDKKWKIFRRAEKKVRAGTEFPFTTPVRIAPGTARMPRVAEHTETTPGLVAEKLLMQRYAPPCLVVNEKFEIIYTSTRTSPFLELPVGKPTHDLLKMARNELRPALRAAIYKAFAEESPVAFRGIAFGEGQAVNVLVEPLDSGPSSQKTAMVIFEPAPPITIQPLAEEKPPSDAGSRDALIHQLEEQLRITHEQLQTATEQLYATNEGFLAASEELISMNEEFQSANEELQATNEELETSKEELQALNEELVIVNGMLQVKVEELNQANSDIENLFSGSEIATIFLDMQLVIKGFSPAMAKIFKLVPADIGRPFSPHAGVIGWESLADDAKTVWESLLPLEREVTSLEGTHCFLMRTIPYRAAEGVVDGVFITLIDISERKQMEERALHLASFPQLNPNPVLEADFTGKVTFANPASHRTVQRLGLPEDFSIFLPPDLPLIIAEWDRSGEAVIQREVVLKNEVYGETIFLSPLFNVVRIYAYDITERKKAEQALRESEQRVRRKLDSILAPEGDVGSVDLADIIDPAPMQSLMENFYRLTNIPMALIDQKGTVLVGVGWQDICTKFHRTNPESCKNCIESDINLTHGVPKGTYKVYKCKNNMWDVATPIIVGDRQFGNFFMGQFFFEEEPVDFELFRSQAVAYGFDVDEYLAALAKVPRMSREAVETGMAYFIQFADMISRMGYSNLKLARSLSERDILMESLQKSEERLKRAQEIAHVGSWELDLINNRLTWSDEVYRIFGLKPQEFGATYEAFIEAVHPEDRAAVDAAYTTSLEEGRDRYQIEHRVLRKRSGEVRMVLEKCEHGRDASGRLIRSVGMVQDITERKLAEEELQKTHRRQDLLAETASELLKSNSPQEVVEALCRKVMDFLDCQVFFNFLVDEWEGRLRLNACAGIPTEESRRIEWLDFGVAVCGCAARDACRIVAENIPGTSDPRTELVKSYGILAYACHPLIAQGKVMGTLSFGTRSRSRFEEDELSLMKAVTDQVAIAMERKKSEKMLGEAKEAAEEASNAKSRFLANMSHELRTPMTGVLGMLQLTLDTSLDAQQRDFIETAHSSARSLLRILNDILDLSRVERGKLSVEEKPFSPRDCLLAALEVIRPEGARKGLSITETIADDIPKTVIGDQMRLRQVLINLLGNAVKFTDSGCIEIHVSTGATTSPGKREMIFTVADTGIGIPEEKKEAIFRSFSQADESHTRRYGGAGLGLAISKEIVELMGGTISFESREGTGSRFSFTIPFNVAGAPEAAVQPATGQTATGAIEDGRRLNLLVAEDDPTTRKLLGRILAKSHHIDIAEDGRQVLEMWEQGNYELVLMDVQMPYLDGFAATGAIREKERAQGRKPTLIIAMTAHAFKEDEERCLAAGMDAYLAKPIDIQVTLETIRNLTWQRAASDQMATRTPATESYPDLPR